MEMPSQTSSWIFAFATSLAALAGCDQNEQLSMEVIKSAQPVAAGVAAVGRRVGTNPQGAAGTAQVAGPLSDFDRRFLTAVAEEALYEEALARLAAQVSSDPATKAMAATLLERHRAINETLMKVAAGRDVVLPAALPPSRQIALDKLAPPKGAAAAAKLT